ncbi:MAG: TetR/AcrR family transcriptional regulator [Trueperaceae bacterium]|nr:TetR/AcrR family transcriptional regulator [Trueperaceae bacterium]
MPITQLDPRIERTRRVVLDAAIEVIAERGFAGATVDAIATRSGVARSTIYRNWDDPSALLLEAVRARVGPVAELVVGDVRQDLLAVCRHLATLLTQEPMASVAASLALESRRDPSLDALHRRFAEGRMRALAEVVEGAKACGDLPDAPDAETVATDLGAAIFFRAMVLRAPIEPAWLEAHVDACLARYGAV